MKKVILLILSAFFFCGLSAQTTVEKKESGAIIINIDPQKPKAIKSLIDKKEWVNLKQLRVRGPLKDKDIQFIYTYLTNLEALDLSGAIIYQSYEYPPKSGKIYNEKTFVIPQNSKITKLGVPLSCEELENNASNNFDILIGRHLKIITGKPVDVGTFVVSYSEEDDRHYYGDKELYETTTQMNFSPQIITNTSVPLDKMFLKQEHINEISLNNKAIINRDYYNSKPTDDGGLSWKVDAEDYTFKGQYRYRVGKKIKHATTFALITYSENNLWFYGGFKNGYITEMGIEPVFLVLYGKKYISLVNHYGITPEVKLSDYEKYVDRIDEIEPYAFMGHSEIKSIDLNVKGLTYLGAYVFAGTNITSVTIPESITQISPHAFDDTSIKEVIIESQYPPVIEDKYVEYNPYNYNEPRRNIANSKNINDIQFIIPQNSKEKYSIGYWKQLHIREAGTQTDYEFTIEKPGTLSNYINDENASNIINLKLKGFLDDTDYDALKKCKNLNKLDMSHCFTIISEKTQKAERDKEEAELAILQAIYGLATEEAKRQYNRGETSIGTVLETHTVKNYLDEIQKLYDNDKFVADKNCKMPYKALEGLSVLKEFAYPVQLESAYVSLPASIEKVTLPPMATEIGGFGGCKKLKTLQVPSSVTSIKPYSFKGCNIDELDLSDTQITVFPEESFENCHITVFKAPKGLKRMCCGHKFQTDNAWYYTQEPPTCFSFEGKMIHIPIGTKAGWNSVDKRTIIIDDIILE